MENAESQPRTEPPPDAAGSAAGAADPAANPSPVLKDFFPATADTFVAKCGAIEAVRASDFEDRHRRRHLESFKRSWDEWAAFDQAEKTAAAPQDPLVTLFVRKLIQAAPQTLEEFTAAQRRLRRELHVAPSKSQMLAVYSRLTEELQTSALDAFLVKKVVRTHSGVVVITVLTSPGSFSCPQDCHYCPNEPGQPRSYLSTEPAVLRANQNGWDPAAQFWDRALTLARNGHTIDKIEILVLGGTWSGYPKAYQEEFICDLFFAANTFPDVRASLEMTKPRASVSQSCVSVDAEVAANGSAPALSKADGGGKLTSESESAVPVSRCSNAMGIIDPRKRLSLAEEQEINKSASCRIIGLTLETRPDHISPGELRRLRRFGCTRVQIGIQHTNDTILEGINRGHTLAHAIRALRLLKDACFKVDIHLMPDLPGSSPRRDKAMFEFALSSDLLQADQWKIYPCEVTPFSTIEQWYKEGRFLPYAEQDEGRALTELLVHAKAAVHPWIRLNRIVRDIPNPSIIAGNSKTNLRQQLELIMKHRQLFCRCLRCREVKTKNIDPRLAELKIREYQSFGGTDYFLSYESHDEKELFGFLRLRIRRPGGLPANDKQYGNNSKLLAEETFNLSKTFPELEGAGLVRELHVYGRNFLRVQGTGALGIPAYHMTFTTGCVSCLSSIGKLVGAKERKITGDIRPQHSGFGRKLLWAAEVIAESHGLQKMAVIAGVGTTEYYQKFGYQIENHFMTKPITATKQHLNSDPPVPLPLRVQVYSKETVLGAIEESNSSDMAPHVVSHCGSERLIGGDSAVETAHFSGGPAACFVPRTLGFCISPSQWFNFSNILSLTRLRESCSPSASSLYIASCVAATTVVASAAIWYFKPRHSSHM